LPISQEQAINPKNVEINWPLHFLIIGLYGCVCLVSFTVPWIGLGVVLLVMLVASLKVILPNLAFIVLFAVLMAIPVVNIIAGIFLIIFFFRRIGFVIKNFSAVSLGFVVYAIPLYGQKIILDENFYIHPLSNGPVFMVVIAMVLFHFGLSSLYKKGYTTGKALEVMSIVPLVLLSLVLPFVKLGDFLGHLGHSSVDPVGNIGAPVSSVDVFGSHGVITDPLLTSAVADGMAGGILKGANHPTMDLGMHHVIPPTPVDFHPPITDYDVGPSHFSLMSINGENSGSIHISQDGASVYDEMGMMKLKAFHLPGGHSQIQDSTGFSQYYAHQNPGSNVLNFQDSISGQNNFNLRYEGTDHVVLCDPSNSNTLFTAKLLGNHVVISDKMGFQVRTVNTPNIPSDPSSAALLFFGLGNVH
jgi:hypothetical protein